MATPVGPKNKEPAWDDNHYVKAAATGAVTSLAGASAVAIGKAALEALSEVPLPLVKVGVDAGLIVTKVACAQHKRHYLAKMRDDAINARKPYEHLPKEKQPDIVRNSHIQEDYANEQLDKAPNCSVM